MTTHDTNTADDMSPEQTTGAEPEVETAGAQPVRAGTKPVKKPGRRRILWAIIAAVVVVVACVAVAVPFVMGAGKKPGSQYKTATATRTALVVTASGDGNTMAVDSTDVYPVVSGTVNKLFVRVGSTVKYGERLYTIKNSDLAGNVLSARATLNSQKQSRKQASQNHAQAEQSLANAQATSLQATQNLDTLESKPATTPGISDQIALARKQVTAAEEGVDAARAGLRTAEAGITASKSNLKSAQYNYDLAVKNAASTTVYAPAAGVITTMSLKVGQSVSGGSSAAAAAGGSTASASGSTGGSTSSGATIVISDASTLKVRVQISESDRPQVKVGQRARLTFDAQPKLETTGTVSWIAPTGTDTQGVVTYDVDLTMAEQDPALQPGMTSTADIVTKSAEALVVPNAAIKVDGQTKYVTTLASDGTTKRVTVATGSVSDGFTEILTGLTEGAVVVTGTKTTAAGGGGLLPSMGN